MQPLRRGIEFNYRGQPGERTMKIHLECLLSASAALAMAGNATAATLPKEGSYDVTVCWSGNANRIDFSKTHWALSSEFMGTALSNPSGGFGDRNSFRCVGAISSFDGKLSGGNVCEVTDLDGDKRLNVFTQNADGTVSRETVAGTGKYEGMVVTTKVENIPPFPTAKPGTFQGCNRQT